MSATDVTSSADGAPHSGSAANLVRVWLVVSAVWLVFWAATAGLLVATLNIGAADILQLGLLIAAPPLLALTGGTAALFARRLI